MRKLAFIIVSSVSAGTIAQPNCSVYKENEPCFKACEMAVKAEQYQGARQSQLQFDEAIALCPAFDYAYFEKSVPYLKRGQFIEWKKLIDKAVELNPSQHLGYRGWCRFQFLRDYEGAIADLERLRGLIGPNLGYSVNGDYPLGVALALCYKQLGQKQKAIEIIEAQFQLPNYLTGIYDYLHLGVLKLETGDLPGAVSALEKQIGANDYLAETHYYLAMAYKQMNQTGISRQSLVNAKEFYLKGYKRFDPYTHPVDKVFLSMIEEELSALK